MTPKKGLNDPKKIHKNREEFLRGGGIFLAGRNIHIPVYIDIFLIIKVWFLSLPRNACLQTRNIIVNHKVLDFFAKSLLISSFFTDTQEYYNISSLNEDT